MGTVNATVMYSIMSSHTQKPRITWTGRPPRIVAGQISGTSADGIATVIVRLSENRNGLSIKQLAFSNIPYPKGMQRTILANSLPGSGSVDIITRLHAAIGVAFARAVHTTARRAGIPLLSIDLIGSHGQTVHHLPEPGTVHGLRVRATLQLGDPSVIAQGTGVPVVGDFRPADMAVGGQGAPLVPFLDYLLFRSTTRSRLLLNLGGIANFTALPHSCAVEDVIAFDTGPANMVIDALSKELYGRPFDKNGVHARRGTADPRLVSWMMSHPYIKAKPPKSTGREDFGAAYVRELRRQGSSIADDDLLATATEFTARSVFEQYKRFVHRHHRVDEVLVSGGGVHNRFLMERLQSCFGDIPVRPTTAAGYSVDAKEALLFAVLAYWTAMGRPSNLPRVSGAKRSVILGKICLP